jgi:hypothetical protein
VTRALHEHITHHAQNPFRGLNDLISKVTATTGQWIPLRANGNRIDPGAISCDLTRVDTCRLGGKARSMPQRRGDADRYFRRIFCRCSTGQFRAFRVNGEVYLPPVR